MYRSVALRVAARASVWPGAQRTEPKVLTEQPAVSALKMALRQLTRSAAKLARLAGAYTRPLFSST